MNDLRTPVIVLVALLVVVAITAIVSLSLPFSPQPSAAIPSRQVPPLTPEMQAVLAKSHGFQALVSYTDRGFEPSTITIKKGETVRFTNNSSGDLLWVASTGTMSGKVYPADSAACGQSAFDVCQSLKPHEFWEFTFTAAGTWSYQNNLDPSQTGIVRVTS
jgi:plastocyanin